MSVNYGSVSFLRKQNNNVSSVCYQVLFTCLRRECACAERESVQVARVAPDVPGAVPVVLSADVN